MGDPNNIGDSWRTVGGQIINPDAPAGGGGAGSFRTTAGTLGVDDPFIPRLPSPDAPAARYVDPAIPLDADTPPPEKINTPPATTTGTTEVVSSQDELNDIDVKVEVLNDLFDPNLKDSGDADFSRDDVKGGFPGFNIVDGKITAFKGKFVFKGNLKIQAAFRTAGIREMKSAYGRGTTDADIKSGDVTLGFHEACHIIDYKDYIKDNPLPTPTFSVGMTPAQYTAAQNSFKTKYDKWYNECLANSEKLTDEVGNPTKSQHKANKQPKKKP